MNIRLSFDELSQYIAAHNDKDLSFSMVAPNEVALTMRRRVIIKNVSLSIRLIIDAVEPAAVTIIYHGGIALDTLIRWALAVLRRRRSSLVDGITTSDGHRITINLNRVDKARALVESLSLESLTVTPEGFSLDATLK